MVTVALAKHYKSVITKILKDQFKYKSVMEVPRIIKITLNMGVGEAVADKKILDKAFSDMTKISGQKPIMTFARQSISTFKIREGWPIGCKVTLRRDRMYSFLEKMIDVVIPRVRDFRGLSPKGFDGNGNYAMGLKEQLVFPEIEYDKIDKVRGMDIIIVTTASNDNEALELLKSFNMPFRNQDNKN